MLVMVQRELDFQDTEGLQTRQQKDSPSNGARLGFEEKLWAAADVLRGHMDAAEYKHVVLGLVFLKYVSDAFEERRNKLLSHVGDPLNHRYIESTQERDDLLEDRNEYSAANVFWVPEVARWSFVQARTEQPAIGRVVDKAMTTIEQENPSLRGILPKNYSRRTLDKRRLGELIKLIGTIGLGDETSRSKDVLGRVYEYFLGRFANVEQGGGEFYTPQSVVKLLVEMLEPYKVAFTIHAVDLAGCSCNQNDSS